MYPFTVIFHILVGKYQGFDEPESPGFCRLFSRKFLPLAVLLLGYASGMQAQCGFTISPESESLGCFESIADVVWTDVVNLNVNGNSLDKPGGGASWNASAMSTAWVEDFGFARAIVTETNRERYFGLSQNNGGNNPNSIQYAFRLRNNGQYEIRESGTNRGNFGNYSTGDTLQIDIENETVRYSRNGLVVYVSNVAPSLPLRVDVAFRHGGGSLADVQIGNFSNGSFFAHTDEDISALNPTYTWMLNGVPSGSNASTYSPLGLTDGDVLSCSLFTTGGCADAGVASNEINIRLAEAYAPGNFFITAIPSLGACSSSSEEVRWDANSLSNVNATGNSLVKLQGGTNWNANASSLNLVADNGHFEFTSGENNLQKAVGLSHTDVDANYTSIQYCFDLRDNGTIRIYESGTNRGTFGNYAAGDQFKIALENGTVVYYRNDEAIYVSNVSPALPLMADVSIRQVNATVQDAHITNLNEGQFVASASNAGPSPVYQWKLNGSNTGSNSPGYANPNLNAGDVVSCELSPDLGGCESLYFNSNTISKDALPEVAALDFYITGTPSASACNSATEEVQWNSNSLINVLAVGNNLTKIQGGTSWNANAFSLNQVADNGSLHFSTAENDLIKAIGLSQQDANSNYTSIDYCFYLDNNSTVRIYESGINRGSFGNYSAGDVFEIAVEDGVIKYYKNNTLLRISNVEPSLPLHADVSMRQVNSTLSNVRITNLNEGAFTANVVNAGDNPTLQWKLNGSNVGDGSNTYVNSELQDGDVVSCELSPDLGGCNDVAYTSNSITQNVVADPASINFFVTGIVAPSACYTTTEEVQWNGASLVNVVSAGNNVLKVQGGTSWNASAFASNAVADNGAFSFSTAESNQLKAAGLSHSQSNSNYTSINYCFYLEGNGNLRIYENGTYRGNFGTYSAGDSLSIAVEAGVVKYYNNGALLRISSVTPSLPLHPDVSIRNVNGSITQAYITNLNGGSFAAHASNAGDNPQYQWKLNGINTGINSSSYTNHNLVEGDIVTCDLIPDLGGCSGVTYTSNAVRKNEVDNPVSINFYISGEVAESACHAGIEDVQWDAESLLHVQANGNNIIKIQSNNNWNGNASSFNTVHNEGSFSFSSSENNRAKAAGLSNSDSGDDRNSIQYCFFMEGNGNLRIYESGTDRGNFGTYAPGDSLNIAVESGVVKYYRNGNLLRISPVIPNLPLIADVSLFAIDATIQHARMRNLNGGSFTANVENAGSNPSYQWKLNGNNVGANSSSYTNNALNDGDIVTCELNPDLGGCGSLTYTSNSIVHEQLPAPASINFFITGSIAEASCHSATEEVQWNTTSLNNVQANGTDLLKVQSTAWNGNASSLNLVGNDGALSFSTSETNRAKAIGLSQADTQDNYNSIDYCFYLEANSNIRIYESGTYRGNFGNYSAGDSLSIAIEAGTVKYYNNGNLLRISTVPPSTPMLADVSLYSVNSTITNTRVTNLNGGVFTASVDEAGDSPTFQWQLNGVNVGDNSSTYSNPDLNAADVITCMLTPDLGGCGNLSYTSNAIVKNSEDEPAAINFYISGASSANACLSAVEEVQWNLSSLSNNSHTGSNLIKVQGGNAWNGNAASLNTVWNNGSFSFSTDEQNRAKAAGLSPSDVNSNYTSIRYCFYLEGNSNIRIYENGANRGNFGTYSVSDSLNIAVDNGTVKYYKNGNLLYISTLAPSFPLYADVSTFSINSTITNAKISNLNGGAFTANADNAGDNPTYQWKLNGVNTGSNSNTYINANLTDGDIITCDLQPDLAGCATVMYTSNAIEARLKELSADIAFYARGIVDQTGYAYAEEQVVWNPSELVNIEASGSNLVKVQGGSSWNAGAASYNTVADNGYFEFTVSETNRRRMVGLSSSNANANFNTIRYAFYLDNAALRVFENGTNRGTFGALTSGDRLRIAVEEGSVKYYRNGSLLYTSNLAPSLPLLVDVSINVVGGTVSDAVVANISGGTFIAVAAGAGDNPTFQWRRNGVNVGGNNAGYSNTNLFDGDVITCIINPDLQGCTSAAYESNEIRIIGPGATTDWTGAINSDWNLSGNWSDGLPNQFRSAFIPNGVSNWPYVNALSQVFNIELEEGTLLGFTGTNTLQVYGDFINNGTFAGGSGTLVFIGEGSRMITGNNLSIHRLVVNLSQATDSIILQGDISILNEALLLSGVIYTGSNQVIYRNGAENRFSSSGSYVDGLVRKTGTDEFTFPVGRAGIYAPVSISAPTQAGSQFTAEYFNEDPEEAGYMTDQKDDSLSNLSRCEYWMVNRDVGTSAVSVSLSYENERSCGVNDPSQLKVVRWNGSAWQDHGYLIHEGDASAGSITSAAPIVNFSPFTIGSGSPINPLPVELLHFAAKAQHSTVELQWATASETNNDHFRLERSLDGQHFELVAIVEGAGNSNSTLQYSHTDLKPYTGTSYYRLTQTDYDGSSKTYPMQAVHLNNGARLLLYPNPSEGQVTVTLNGNDAPVVIEVMNLTGQLLHKELSDNANTQLDLSSLAPGVYVIVLTQGEARWQQKLVLRH